MGCFKYDKQSDGYAGSVEQMTSYKNMSEIDGTGNINLAVCAVTCAWMFNSAYVVIYVSETSKLLYNLLRLYSIFNTLIFITNI